MDDLLEVVNPETNEFWGSCKGRFRDGEIEPYFVSLQRIGHSSVYVT
jgi:hypothetical protein